MRSVTVGPKASSDRLGEMCSASALILQDLESSGRLSEIGERLQVQREGGYAGIDVFIFLVCFYAAGAGLGVKAFFERIRGQAAALAGVAGRKTLPTPASVSRLLGAVQAEDCDPFGPWLLREGCDARTVLRHPTVLHRDGQGEGWHVFDFDPTKTVLRQRALPASEELPAVRRRSSEARPGYSGRKRGDVQLSRATLQHAGSALRALDRVRRASEPSTRRVR